MATTLAEPPVKRKEFKSEEREDSEPRRRVEIYNIIGYKASLGAALRAIKASYERRHGRYPFDLVSLAVPEIYRGAINAYISLGRLNSAEDLGQLGDLVQFFGVENRTRVIANGSILSYQEREIARKIALSENKDGELARCVAHLIGVDLGIVHRSAHQNVDCLARFLAAPFGFEVEIFTL